MTVTTPAPPPDLRPLGRPASDEGVFLAAVVDAETRAETRARHTRARADARAEVLAVQADLRAALARADRDYERLASRSDELDRRLRTVRQRLAPATVGGPDASAGAHRQERPR